MEDQTLKIAAVTDDGITISPHFGRAKYYEVIYVENGKVIKKERREKISHHGHGHTHRHRHFEIAEPIKDCQILLSRGMGTGAYQNLLELNIKPIITDIKNIDDAVQAVIDGSIVNHTEKLH